MARLRTRRTLHATALVVGLVLTTAGTATAQTPPPGNATIALEGTMNRFYRAANVVIVTTVDGIEHVYRFTKDLIVHGGKGSGVDALEGLREGSTVVVHYNPQGTEQAAREIDVIGDEGLEITEGTVTRIDRGRKQITVRYDNGTTETFRLTERAAVEDVDQATPAGTKVTVYYSDEHGHKVVHFFRRISH